MRMLRNRVLLFCIVALVLGGCTHHAIPKQMPEVGLDAVGRLEDNMSIDLINAQDDTTEHLFYAMGIHRYYADYNQWTQFFIDNYSKELNKRGVTVSKDSPNKIKVKLSDFAGMQGMFVIRVNMKIRFQQPEQNWEKEWNESDTSGWSGGRALGSVLHNSIKRILLDSEVNQRMAAKN